MHHFTTFLVIVTGLCIFPNTTQVGDSYSNSETALLTGQIAITGDTKQSVVLYIDGVDGDYELGQMTIVVEQKNKVFLPHLSGIQKGEAVTFENNDPFLHTVSAYRGSKQVLNIAQRPNGRFRWFPPDTGQYTLLCKSHTEMSAFLLVLDHPFFATIDPTEDREGRPIDFEIGGIPEGTYTLVGIKDVNGSLVRQEEEITLSTGMTNTVDITF